MSFAFSVIYCELSGRMEIVHGDPSAIRAEADAWAHSVPGHAVHVMTSTYSTSAPIPAVDHVTAD